MAEKELSLHSFYKGLKLKNSPEIKIIKPNFGKQIPDNKLISILQKIKPIRENSLIIVNDHDRSTPTAKIVNLLRSAGILTKPTKFVIATGTHKFPDSINPIKFTGARDGDKVIIHDCDDEENLIYLGKTKNGTEVAVNKLLLEFDDIITINSVEPHYFAGFTGGIKSLIPGLAARNTIVQNHKWAIKPESCILHTNDNPLHRDLWEAGNLIRNLEDIQSIQLINNRNDIFHISVGSLLNSFDEAKSVSLKSYGTHFIQKFDHIISFVADPLDHTLYQAQKAMENTKNVLKENGTFTLVAKCDRGIGNALFFERMQSLGSLKKIIETLSFKRYRFGDHKTYYWANLANNAQLFYIGDLSKEIASKAFMKKISGDELIENVKKWHQENQNILIDEFGGFSTAFIKKLTSL